MLSEYKGHLIAPSREEARRVEMHYKNVDQTSAEWAAFSDYADVVKAQEDKIPTALIDERIRVDSNRMPGYLEASRAVVKLTVDLSRTAKLDGNRPGEILQGIKKDILLSPPKK